MQISRLRSRSQISFRRLIGMKADRHFTNLVSQLTWYCRALGHFLVLAGLASSTLAEESAGGAGPPRVTILSTMLADFDPNDGNRNSQKVLGEWGFAALIEVDGNQFLYDTGFNPQTVMTNAELLGIDLSGVEDVIISHNHRDHTGGLMALRNAFRPENPNAFSRIHVGKGIEAFRRRAGSKDAGWNSFVETLAGFQSSGGQVIYHTKPSELAPGVWVSGQVPRKHDERNFPQGFEVFLNGEWVPNIVPEDMSVIIETPEGLVVLSGCGHAGLINIVEYATSFTEEKRLAAVIGGFHLLDASEEQLAWTAENLRRFELRNFIGAHCTGVEAAIRLRSLIGLERVNAAVGAVGQSYTPTDGISTGWIAR